MILIKKAVSLLLTLLLVSFTVFMAFQIIPGDSVIASLGTEATPQQIAAMREELGLNKPLLSRYGEWFAGFITGNLGTSYSYHLPVSEIISDKLPVTLILSGLAFVLMLIISFPLGVILGQHAGSIPDAITTFLNQIIMSVPPFFIGILFSSIFGLSMRLFIPGKFVPLSENPAAFWRYLFFPALAIALPKSAMTIKLLRSTILNETYKDYVRTAYSRGNRQQRAMRVHVLRNALIPVITFLMMTFSSIVAGSIIIEQIFVIPGIGRLLLVSISGRDFPVVQTVVMIIAFIVIIMNYLADLLCQVIDPRTRMN